MSNFMDSNTDEPSDEEFDALFYDEFDKENVAPAVNKPIAKKKKRNAASRRSIPIIEFTPKSKSTRVCNGSLGRSKIKKQTTNQPNHRRTKSDDILKYITKIKQTHNTLNNKEIQNQLNALKLENKQFRNTITNAKNENVALIRKNEKLTHKMKLILKQLTMLNNEINDDNYNDNMEPSGNLMKRLRIKITRKVNQQQKLVDKYVKKFCKLSKEWNKFKKYVDIDGADIKIGNMFEFLTKKWKIIQYNKDIQIKALRNKLTDKDEEIKELNDDIARIKEQYRKGIHEFEYQTNQSENELNINQLKAKYNKEVKLLNDIKEKKQSAIAEYDEYQNKIKMLKEKQSAAVQQIKELQPLKQQNDDNQKQVTISNQKSINLITEIEKLKSNQIKMDDRMLNDQEYKLLKDLKQQNDDYCNEIEILNEYKMSLSYKIEELKHENSIISDLRKQIKLFKQQNDDYKKQIQILNKNKTEKDKLNDENTIISELKEKIKLLNESNKIDLMKLMKLIDKLQKENDTNINIIKNLQQEIQKKESFQSNEIQNLKNSFFIQKKDKIAEINEYKKEINDLQQKLDKIQIKKIYFDKYKISYLNREICELKNIINCKNDEINNLKENVYLINSKYKELHSNFILFEQKAHNSLHKIGIAADKKMDELRYDHQKVVDKYNIHIKKQTNKYNKLQKTKKQFETNYIKQLMQNSDFKVIINACSQCKKQLP